jgi:hypothetical protein
MLRLSLAFLLLLPSLLLAADKPVLPAAWHGEWKGELVIFAPDGKTTTVPLTLVVAPVDKSDALTWKATYGDGAKAVVKDYKLVPGDKPGRVRIDEGNGIVLDARLDGGVLLSVFEVGGAVLTSRDELRDGKLRREVTSAKKGAKTGGGVQGYDVVAVQRAELSKAK